MAASREELESLIRAADAAGDGDAVNVLFAEMDKLGAAPKAQAWTPPSGTMPMSIPQLDPISARFASTLPRLGDAIDAGTKKLGVTAEANPMSLPVAPLETGLQMGTGLLGTITGGLAGLGQGAWNAAVPEKYEGPQAADRVRQVQQAMTFQPRTSGGQLLSGAVSLPGRAWEAGTDYVGGKVTDATGSPALGTAIKTLGDGALPGFLAVRGMPKGPKPNEKAPPNTKYDVPTTEQLRAETNAAYKRGKESGVMVKADAYAKAADEISENAKAEALDPVLHPKSSRIVQVLQERKGKDLDLQEAENLRRIALEAEGDVNNVGAQTGDGRIAGKIVDDLDDKIDALTVNAEARALNRRKSNSQMLDVMVDRAQTKAGANYTQSGLENALRKEFQSLALNTRRLKRLTASQQDAVKRVARGGKLENTLRNLGKFDPLTGGMGTAISLGLGGGFALPTGGMSMLLPAIGFASKRGATKMAVSNVDKAREALVGRGTTGGLLNGGSATQPLLAPRGLLGAPAPRSAAQLRKEISSLDLEVQRLQAMGPASSTVRAAVESELARLRRELEGVEAQGERP